MKLLFKQRVFSWFDSYDIYNENGGVEYTVHGQLSFGHCFKIIDSNGNEVGSVRQRVFTFLPKFEVYLGDSYLGCISKHFSLFKPSYSIDYNGWEINGDFLEWDYTLSDSNGSTVATVSKELFKFTDTYVIDIVKPEDALTALMFVLAIDAEKCSRD